MCTKSETREVLQEVIGNVMSKHHDDLAEKIAHAFNNVIGEVIKHDKPSKDTSSFMEDTKVNQAVMRENMKRLEEKIDQNLNYNRRALDKIEEMEQKKAAEYKEMREENEKKFASKDVERWVKYAIGLVVTTFLLAVLALFFDTKIL